MLNEKAGHLCESYRSSLSLSESLTVEISSLCEWIDKVKTTLSASRPPLLSLSIQENKDLLYEHEV